MKVALLALFLFLSCVRCFAIDVVYVCNDGYAYMLATSIESMLSNKANGDDINIFVLQHDFTDKTISSLVNVVRGRAHIQFIKFDIHQLDGAPENFHIMTYSKILILDKLTHLSKVLYIDVDTLIVSSLAEFYDTDLGDNYAAVVQDQHYPIEADGEYNTKLYNGIYKNVKGWFNAGVMLLNIKKCLQDDILSKFFYHMKNVKHFYGDQPIFNHIFDRKIIYAKLKWNVTTANLVAPTYKHPAPLYSEAELKEAALRPSIVHLSGHGYLDTLNPWHVDFFSYLRKTPWRHLERRLLMHMHLRSIGLTDMWEILKLKYF